MAEQNDEADLKPTPTEGYKAGEAKTLDEYAKLDAEDESLNKWKASLGIGAAGSGDGKPKVTIYSLSLFSDSLPNPIILDLTDPSKVAAFKQNPVTIKEGAEYSVELKFKVEGGVVSGIRYIQVVKRAGIKVDKLESMVGSYGPSGDFHTKRFISEEAPTGMLARSGSYNARSRITDDDGHVWMDFDWSFKLGKEW